MRPAFTDLRAANSSALSGVSISALSISLFLWLLCLYDLLECLVERLVALIRAGLLRRLDEAGRSITSLCCLSFHYHHFLLGGSLFDHAGR